LVESAPIAATSKIPAEGNASGDCTIIGYSAVGMIVLIG
jgi:hypothetical protein